MNKTTETIVTTVAAVALPTLEQRKAEYIAKLQAEMETTKSFWVKIRNSAIIAAVNTASDAAVEKIISKAM
jgi:hypothetical protein